MNNKINQNMSALQETARDIITSAWETLQATISSRYGKNCNPGLSSLASLCLAKDLEPLSAKFRPFPRNLESALEAARKIPAFQVIVSTLEPILPSITQSIEASPENHKGELKNELKRLWRITGSPSFSLLAQLKEENPQIATDAENTFEEIINQPVPSPPSPVLDALRFMGAGNELPTVIEKSLTEAITNTTRNLYARGRIPLEYAMNNYYTQRLLEYLEFAKAVYSASQLPQRKTGEPSFFHPIGTVWLCFDLLTLNPMRIYDEKSLNQLVENSGVASVHDILEDIPSVQLKQSGTGFAFSFPQSPTKTLTLYLSRREALLLLHLTKDPAKKEQWLQQIAQAGDNQYPQFGEEENIQRAVACVKLADRLHNLLTMAYTGKSLIDVLAKLEETIQTGWQIGWLAHFANRGPLEILAFLQYYHQRGILFPSIEILSLLAQAEKLRLIAWMGKEFCLRLIEKNPKISEGMVADFFRGASSGGGLPWEKEVFNAMFQKKPDSPPPHISHSWKKTLFSSDKNVTRSLLLQSLCIPWLNFPNFFGFEHLARSIIRQRHFPFSFPLSVGELLEEAGEIHRFCQSFNHLAGTWPGGVDDVLVPSPSASPHDIHRILQRELNPLSAPPSSSSSSSRFSSQTQFYLFSRN